MKRFWKDFWWLLVYTFVGAVAVVMLTLLVTKRTEGVVMLHLVQWLQTVLMFWLPACLWARCYKKERVCDVMHYRLPDAWQLGLTAVLMLVSLPALDALATWCEALPLPAWLQDYAQQTSAAQEQVVALLISPGGVGGWTELVLLMCVGTAVAEESMFRGALLRCLVRSQNTGEEPRWKRLWVALVVGLIFSACHGDVYGFVPRWLLGAVFTYLVYWTGSLWPSVLAHAMNNLWALIEMKEAPQLLEQLGASTVIVLGSVALSAAVLCAIRQRRHSVTSKVASAPR